jgi:hypothetical protein
MGASFKIAMDISQTMGVSFKIAMDISQTMGASFKIIMDIMVVRGTFRATHSFLFRIGRDPGRHCPRYQH